MGFRSNTTRPTCNSVGVMQLRQQALNPSFEAKGEHEHDEEVEGEVIYALLKAFLNEKYNQNKQSVSQACNSQFPAQGLLTLLFVFTYAYIYIYICLHATNAFTYYVAYAII